MSTLMDFTLPPEGFGLIDSLNPIETEHPLNRGLVSWWLAPPHLFGSAKFWDLCNRNHGILTNGPLWKPMPGGFGSVAFDGSDDYVHLGTSLNYAAVTYSAWVRATAWTNAYSAIVNRNNNFGTYVELYVKSTGKLALYTTPANYDGTGTYTLSAGVWYHVVLTYNSVAGLAGYVDGRLDGTAAPSGALSTTAIAVSIGNVIPFGGRALAGSVGDVRIYSRALAASEVYALYQQSLLGHPNTLRRYPERSWFILNDLDDAVAPPGGALAFNAAWTRANTFMGAF